MSDHDLAENKLSDFEDGEDGSVEEVVEMMKALKPYQFEPEQDFSDTDTNESDADESFEEESLDDETVRTGHLNWCLCSRCKVEEREIDCLCCQELAALNGKFDSEKNIKCITEAKEFKTLCLNKAVLQNVLVGLHDARGDYLEENTTN